MGYYCKLIKIKGVFINILRLSLIVLKWQISGFQLLGIQVLICIELQSIVQQKVAYCSKSSN